MSPPEPDTYAPVGLRIGTDGTVEGAFVPPGVVFHTASGDVPGGYLSCNGAAIGRATYPDLFAAIGTRYGAGDGSTTFNLPNLNNGRFVRGSNIPASGGAESHTHPDHTHPPLEHGHSVARNLMGVTAGGDFSAVTHVTVANAVVGTNPVGIDSATHIPPFLTLKAIIKT